MAFWIFKCSSEQYRLADRLTDPNPITCWRVTRHRDEIGSGDIVFIWETGASRGIRAVVRLNDAPRKMAELEDEQPYNVERDTAMRWRVLGTFTHRTVNLPHTVLRGQSGLENLSVLRTDVVQRGTNFPVTADEGAILLHLVAAEAT